jgi:DNA processing protein
MDAREALVALNLIEGIGPVRVRQLLEHFADPPAILGANAARLQRVAGIGPETAAAIAGWEKTVDLTGELRRIKDFGCHIVIQSDENYPELLKQIYDPPIVLYVKGALLPKDKNAVAVVGSRMTTHYGMESARKLAFQLAYVGVTVVSGGARGIDSAAHQGALHAKGRTIAVLGTGINIHIPFPLTQFPPAVKCQTFTLSSSDFTSQLRGSSNTLIPKGFQTTGFSAA